MIVFVQLEHTDYGGIVLIAEDSSVGIELITARFALCDVREEISASLFNSRERCKHHDGQNPTTDGLRE